MLALLVIVPIVGIGVTLLLRKGIQRQPEVVRTVEDPNEDIKELEARFKKLHEQSRTVSKMDRESSRFEIQIKGTVTAWETWLADFERIFAGRRAADGSLPSEFGAYSAMKAKAGQVRLDLIKMSGF